jgi:hypothetical protein
VQDQCTQGNPINLEFRPHLPFGYEYSLNGQGNRDNYVAQCFGTNNGYSQAAHNDYNFWGWSKLYTLLDNVLAAAAAQGITVDELEMQNEVDLVNVTVLARLFCDPTHPPDADRPCEPVLANLQTLMANRMGAAAQFNVTVSIGDTNSTAFGSDSHSDCLSVYGDSARILGVSELLAAIGGGLIGRPYQVDNSYFLACGGSAQFMSPTYPSPTSTIIDLHTKPCKLDPAPGPNQFNCDRAHDDDVYGQGVKTFNGIKTMLDSYGPNGWRGYNPPVYNSTITFGETWKPDNCNTYPVNSDFSNYNAFNASSMATHPVVMLPWTNLVEGNGCFSFPVQINPPYAAEQ